MKALSGYLPLNTKYKVLSYDYNSMEYGTICQNCGKFIANTATVQSESGKVYVIGQDCAEKIIQCNVSNYWEQMQIKKEYNRKRSLIAKLKKFQKLDRVYTNGSFLYFVGDDGIWSSEYRLDYVQSVAKEFNYNMEGIKTK